jgi:hypothetical protein
MATQNVNIGINVSDNGTAKKVVKNFQEITQAATQAQRAAGGINQPVKSTMAPGGTSGSRRASEPTGSQQMMSGQQYGSARGSAGLTGASARDFANQAQGLGGLVRLYATLAANIFAASAAYTALSNAADTTNLVKGLDMLGAASGRSLGTLSKRLVEVTDGAVSMREAMTATAQASSAGMTNKNIERLAQVAKNASLALGVAMPDALSRLSRGIVKLEPELLDELGLFTKIGPATERYALEIGKSVGALTDFERRQAFANAVLEEGEKKFGALSEAASNPYDKLLATLKNVLQSGGELINKVLTPIVSLLAESPTALGAVIAGLGVLLLKQALPAIGQMRAGLRSAAEDALNVAETFKASFGDEFQTILEKRFKIPDLEAGVKKAQADLAKLTIPKNLAPSVQKLAAGEETNMAAVAKVLKNKNKIVEEGMQAGKKASEAQIAAAKQEILIINTAIKALEAKKALQEGRGGTEEVANKPLSRFDPEVIALQKYEKLRGKVDQANAISNAAQVAQVAGVRVAWGLLNKEVADNNITGFAKYSTLVQGGLAAIGSRVMGLLGAFSNIGMAVGVAVAAFQMLDSYMSKNAKQAEAFTKAIKTSEEAVDNVTRTLSAATNLQGFSSNTIANTVAFSNALNELSSSLTEIIKLSREAERTAGTWDNFWDSVFSVANRDRASQLAKTVAKQIQSSIKLLGREGLAEQYQAELRDILGVENLDDFDKVAKAFKSLSKEQQDAVTAIQNNSNRALGNAGAALQAFKDKTDVALKAQKTLSNSFLDTSPAFKYGESLIEVSNSLNGLIAQGPDRVAQALEEVSINLEKGAMFGSEFVSAFAQISAEFGKQKSFIDGVNGALEIYNKQLTDAKLVQSQVASPFPNAPGAMRRGPIFNRQQQANTAVAEAEANVRRVEGVRDTAPRDAIDKSLKLVEAAAKSLFDRGMAFIGRAVREAQTTASITIGRALTSNLTGPQKLQADAAFAQKEIQMRLADIKISEQMMDTQSQLVNEMRLANALQAEANILQKNAGKTDKISTDQNTAAAKEVAKASLSAAGVSGAGLLNSELLSDKEKADVKRTQDRQKMLQQASLQPAKILARGQLEASQLSLKGDLPLSQARQEEELKKITDKTNASLLARQDIISSMAGVTSEELIKSRQNLELSQKASQQGREIADINNLIAQAQSKYSDAVSRDDKDSQKGQLAQIEFLKQVRLRTEEAQKADTSVIEARNRQELLNKEIDTIAKRSELERSSAELKNTLDQTALDTRSQEFALYSSAFDFSRKFVVNQQASLDIQKAQLETSTAIAQVQAGFEQKRLEAVAKINALGDGEGADQRAKEIGDELARQRALTADTVAGLKAQGAAKLDILQKTREINLEQERYNLLLQNSETFAENLSSVFGELGSSLGNLSKVFTEFAISSEKRANSEAKLANDLAAARKSNDPLEIAAAEGVLAEQKKKNAKAELADDIRVLSSSKKLFKEKTAAYKVLDATEKALRIKSMAAEVKNLAEQIKLWWTGVSAKVAAATAGEAGTTAATGAGFASRLPIYIKEIYASWGKMGPWMVGAAALFIAAKLGSRGGGGGAFVPNAEQRQETQGTAMGWDSEGKKVQVRRGVFGDTDAKSESIANSLELIKENSVDGLSYNNRMVDLLQSIDNGINNTAKGLYGIKGLRSGSMFDTIEGKQSGGGLLGTGLFGSKTSRNITDSGLLIEGTFAQLASDTNEAVIDFFEQVTVSKKSWYGKTKTWVETNRREIDDATSDFFQDIFGNATEMFIEIGAKTGVEAGAINQILGGMDVGKNFTSLRGLKGEDFQKELSAVIGTILDDAASAIFTSFETFAKFGEGMLETVVRVVDTNTKINQQIKNVGISSGELSFAITEALAEIAGGLENFLEQSNFFRENFLTETERLVPVQKAVVTEMARLGFATVDTRAEFKALVQGLDLTTTAGQENYQALMDVAEGFDTILDYTEAQADALKDSAQSFRDFITQVKDFKSSLLLGASSTLTPGEKYAEARTQFETIYAQALAGDKTAMSKVTSSAQTFLDASKGYFASSDAYTQDFNSVLTKLDNATISAGASASVAELQLNALSIHTNLLSSIDTNIATIAGVPGLAGGGRASGLALVGEMGPELVDFSMPGRVYSADQTAGMFAPRSGSNQAMGAVVLELQQLRKEVTQLRKDQQQQTGDLIMSNYDANQKASEEVALAVTGTSQDTAWNTRSKSEIK